MKKSAFCLWIILILASSCTKSRFATTTRHYRDGRVVYTNHYANEPSNLHRSRIRHTETPVRDEPAKTAATPEHQPGRLPAMNFITSPGNNSLANNGKATPGTSPGIGFAVNTGARNQPVIPDDQSPRKAGTSIIPVPPDDHLAGKQGNSDLAASPADHPEVDGNLKNPAGPRNGMDTPDFSSENEATPPTAARPAIDKSPSKVSFGEPNRTGDTTLNKAVTGKAKPAKKNQATGPKTEKLGLAGFILSFFGAVPIFGIPFAILGIVFGFVSLGRIKRNPGKYKGNGFAKASIVIGCLMLVLNIIIVITSINAAVAPKSIHVDTSSTKCRV